MWLDVEKYIIYTGLVIAGFVRAKKSWNPAIFGAMLLRRWDMLWGFPKICGEWRILFMGYI